MCTLQSKSNVCTIEVLDVIHCMFCQVLPLLGPSLAFKSTAQVTSQRPDSLNVQGLGQEGRLAIRMHHAGVNKGVHVNIPFLPFYKNCSRPAVRVLVINVGMS